MKVPHTYVLLFGIICLAALLSWLVPTGEFQRAPQEVNGSIRELIVPDSYAPVPAEPQSWQILTAFFKGFERQAGIIVFIFMVGGVFYILQQSRAIDLGILALVARVRQLEKRPWVAKLGAGNLIITLCMLLFAVFGAVFGMSEETIPFVLIFVPLALSLGYDAIVGVAMCFVGAALGFAGALLNPFTIGVAQGIAGVQPFSGIEYRLFCFFVINLVGIAYVLRYAAQVKRQANNSLCTDANTWWQHQQAQQLDLPTHQKGGKGAWWAYGLVLLGMTLFSIQTPISSIAFGSSVYNGPVLTVMTLLFALLAPFVLRFSAHYFVLLQLGFSILGIIVGVLGHHWYMEEIAALFLALGITSAMSLGLGADAFVKQFLDGARDIAGAALVVGLAAGILIVLEQGKVIDAMLYHTAQAFQGIPKAWAVELMLVVQTGINILVPSGSGQAALTMPVMAPLADLLGISRQTAVLAFQFGDGFTNLITPTSGVLIGVLGMARIDYAQWFKFMLPLQFMLMLVGMLLLLGPIFWQLPGF